MKKTLFLTSLSQVLAPNKNGAPPFFFARGLIKSWIELKEFGFNFELLVSSTLSPLQKGMLEFLTREGVPLSVRQLTSKTTKKKQTGQSSKASSSSQAQQALLLVTQLLKEKKEKTAFRESYVLQESRRTAKSKPLTSWQHAMQSALENLGVQAIELQSKKRTSSGWERLAQAVVHRERCFTRHRKTSETEVFVRLTLDGQGRAEIKTGLGFFDHMLENFTKHAGFDLTLTTIGDLQVDEHHTIEDTALVLGETLKQCLGDKRGIRRYASVRLPMDEALALCSVDLSGRSYVKWKARFKREYVGDFPVEMLKHFYETLAAKAAFNLHLELKGENEHHLIEASFKALARCLREAVRREGSKLASTKGSL